MRPSNKSTTGQASLFGSDDAEATAPVATRASARAFTDGSCDTASGHGGWAYLLDAASGRSTASGYEPGTTNNRMELTAAIEALKALKRPCHVVLHTDSQYVQRGVTEWLANWKRRNWRGSTGPVKNQDLWMALDKELQRHRVEWHWVRGHAGDLYNERCDELAGAAIRALKAGL